MAEKGIHGAPFRIGTVIALKTGARVSVRVKFPDRDQMISWWLDTPNYYKPELGDVVICSVDLRDEAGAVVGAIAPNKFSWWPKDGAQFCYDAGAHKLNLLFSDGAVVSYDAGAHVLSIDAPTATVEVLNSAQVSVKTAGDIALITSEHNTSVNQIIDTYNAHDHGDPGEGDTLPPNQLIP